MKTNKITVVNSPWIVKNKKTTLIWSPVLILLLDFLFFSINQIVKYVPILQRVQSIKEELAEEYDTSSEDEEDNCDEDDILDQMLNKLLYEGAHKEALFKDLLVYKLVYLVYHVIKKDFIGTICCL